MPVSKALFVSPAAAAYGSERSMLALLKARRFQAEVVCPDDGALNRELVALGIKVYPLEFNRFALRQNPLWHVAFFRRFRRILKVSQPDVVVINLDGNTPLVTLASVRAGIPIVRFCRFEFKPPTRWIDRWCWLKAKAIICPSELVKQQVLAWAPPELHSRVHRLYDSYAGRVAAPLETAAFRQKFGLEDDKIVGCVGRLDRGKRIEIAIKALAEARKQVGNARLMVIGGDGSPAETAYKEELQQMATDLGVREAVTFTGYRPAEEVPAAIASFDVCVLPSESESFGMVLMEAWAQGVPTVASNVGGCCEISQASGGGYLAPVGDAGAFAGRLLALLTNPESAAAMGQKGKTWVDQSCAPAEYAAKFESVINACKSDTP
jgi:glycosyltransferase involved in cell wall biosynthesis